MEKFLWHIFSLLSSDLNSYFLRPKMWKFVNDWSLRVFTQFQIIFCVAINFCYCLRSFFFLVSHLPHLTALVWRRNFLLNILNRFTSLGPQILNYLICHYEIIIRSNWAHISDDKISLILIYFSSLFFSLKRWQIFI